MIIKNVNNIEDIRTKYILKYPNKRVFYMPFSIFRDKLGIIGIALIIPVIDKHRFKRVKIKAILDEN